MLTLVEVMHTIPDEPDRAKTERLVHDRIAQGAKALADDLERGDTTPIRRKRLERDLQHHRELLKHVESAADSRAKTELERLIAIETRRHTDATYDDIHRRN